MGPRRPANERIREASMESLRLPWPSAIIERDIALEYSQDINPARGTSSVGQPGGGEFANRRIS